MPATETPPTPDPQTVIVIVPTHAAAAPRATPSAPATHNVLGTQQHRGHPGSQPAPGTLPFTGIQLALLLTLGISLLLLGILAVKRSVRAGVVIACGLAGSALLIAGWPAQAAVAPVPEAAIPGTAPVDVQWPTAGQGPTLQAADAAGRPFEGPVSARPGTRLLIQASGFSPRAPLAIGFGSLAERSVTADALGRLMFSFLVPPGTAAGSGTLVVRSPTLVAALGVTVRRS